MAVAVVIAGAIIALGSLIGGVTQSKPGQIEDVKYPEADPTEQEIAKMQLEVARKLREQVDDPTVMQEIYKLLPEENMSAIDRMQFAKEYADIKKQIFATGAQMANEAVGERLEDLVSRGVISPEQAQRQREANEMEIGATLSTMGKRLDAAQIRMARTDWMKKGSLGIGGAGILAQIDQNARSLFNQAVSGGLAAGISRRKSDLNLQSILARSNMQTGIEMAAARTNFGLTFLGGAGKMGVSAMSNMGSSSSYDTGQFDWGSLDNKP